MNMTMRGLAFLKLDNASLLLSPISETSPVVNGTLKLRYFEIFLLLLSFNNVCLPLFTSMSFFFASTALKKIWNDIMNGAELQTNMVTNTNLRIMSIVSLSSVELKPKTKATQKYSRFFPFGLALFSEKSRARFFSDSWSRAHHRFLS